jgi:signal transduction histidine kinase
MCSELERCGNIISGLLSFSRTPSVEYKDIDIHDVLKSVITLTSHKMELQEIKLETDLFPYPLLMRGDVNQLQQCFLNLFFNSIEAMPEGGTLSLSTNLSSDKQTMIVFVKDTGCGIREEDREHIFDPFFTTKGEGEGTGLGLSIVYGIVKTHNGEIKVEGNDPQGTTVRLSFPININ